MRDKIERKHFLEWAKAAYHAEPYQQRRQEQDWEELEGMPQARRKWMSKKHSRWSRELQRRLGSAPLWHMVSFTGKFDVDVLREVSQGGASQTGAGNRVATRDLTLMAQRARDRLRYAVALRQSQKRGRRNFSARQQSELALLANDTLRKEANEATRKSGFGRIRHEDGSYEDIARDGGGIVRTLLDNTVATIADDADLYASP